MSIIRKLWRTTPLPIRQRLHSVRHRLVCLAKGREARVDVGKSSFLVQHNNLTEYRAVKRFVHFEPEFLDSFLGVVAGADVVYDVGGYIGLYSLTAACQNRKARVFTFEPNSINCQSIRSNAQLNGLPTVQVVQCAVGDTEGVVGFANLSPGSSCSTNFVAPASEFDANSVPATTLDAQVSAHQLPAPDVVKIDVEGYEAHVLRGMRKILEDHRPVVLVEVHGEFLTRYGETAAGIDHFMSERGYYGSTLRTPGNESASRHRQTHVAYYPLERRAA